MENVQNKMINGVEFTAPASSGIKKLSTLSQTTPHIIVSKDSKPTRFNSYIVTIINENTEEEYKVYTPEYVAKLALPKRRFIYDGLVKKSDGSGYSFHSILWA